MVQSWSCSLLDSSLVWIGLGRKSSTAICRPNVILYDKCNNSHQRNRGMWTEPRNLLDTLV